MSPVEDPEGLSALDSRIAELEGLQAGWLDGAGIPPTPAAVKNASITLAELLLLDVPCPRLYPTPDGGVQAEWATGDYEVNVTFEQAGEQQGLVQPFISSLLVVWLPSVAVMRPGRGRRAGGGVRGSGRGRRRRRISIFRGGRPRCSSR